MSKKQNKNDPWAYALAQEINGGNYKDYDLYKCHVKLDDVFRFLGIKTFIQTPAMVERIDDIITTRDKWEIMRDDAGYVMGWQFKDNPQYDDEECVIDYDMTNEESNSVYDFMDASSRKYSIRLRREEKQMDVGKVARVVVMEKEAKKLLATDDKYPKVFECEDDSNLYTNNAAILRIMGGIIIDDNTENMLQISEADFIEKEPSGTQLITAKDMWRKIAYLLGRNKKWRGGQYRA